MATERPGIADFPEDLRVHAAWLRRLAVSLVGAGPHSEDAIQETWAAALARPPRQPGALRPWLGTVLRNFVRLRARSDRNRARREDAAGSLAPDLLPSPEELLARHESLSLLAAEVRQLEEPYRSTVLLCYAEDLPPSEIARRQGIPAATVRSRLKRGLAELRKRLEQAEGGDGRSWVVALGLPAGPSLAPSGHPAVAAAKGVLLMKASSKAAVVAVAVLLAIVAGVAIRRPWRSTPPGGQPDTIAGDNRRRPGGFVGSAETGAAGAGTMEGTVRDQEGRAIAGVAIAAAPAGIAGVPTMPALSFSREDGRFRLSLKPGTYRATAAAVGYLPGKREGLNVGQGQTLPGVDFVLVRGGHSLTGRVFDAGGGPIPGARLQVWLDAGWTPAPAQPAVAVEADSAGRYRLSLPRGNHGVAIEAGGYAPQRQVIELRGNGTRDFRLEPAAQVSGRVILARDQREVAGAEVRLGFSTGGPIAFRAQASTDVEGRFFLGGVPPGSYRLTAHKDKLVGGLPQPVVVTAGAVVADLTIDLAPGLGLQGRVLSEGQPVRGAELILAVRTPANFWMPPSARSVSDSEGRFALDGLLAGEYRLGVSAPGYSRWQEDVALRESSSRTIDLHRSVKVVGRVLTSRSEPGAGARIRAWIQPRTGGVVSWDEAVTDAEGRFTLERLAAGDMYLEARHQQEAATLGPRSLKSGDRTDLVVKLTGGARISGVVVWKDGKPADDVRIFANQRGLTSQRPDEVRSARDGSFSIGPLVAGPTTVLAQTGEWVGWGPGRPEEVEVQLAEGEHRSGIRLVVSPRSGYIRGLVLDSRGRPLPGAAVGAAFERAGRSFKRAAQANRALSGADGSFNIEDLPPGVYTLFADHPEHAQTTRPGVPDGSSEVRLTLGRAGTLAGTVVDQKGKPLPSYALLVVPPSFRRETAAMRLEGAPGQALPIPIAHPRGAFEIGGLAPGNYDLQVSTADGLYGNVEAVPVVAGQRRGNLRIIVGAGAQLTGRVLEVGSKQPLVADVRLMMDGAPTARTDASGAFALDGVPPASERMLEVRTPGDSHVHERWSVAVPANGGRVDIGVIWLLPGPERRLEPRGGGTGLYLGRTPTDIAIYDVRPGSPGDQNGIRPGDRLVAIDGRDVRHLGQRAAGVILMGQPGTPVNVTVIRAGQAPWSVQLVRAPAPPIVAAP
jgi:RNA polymerase sigma factor (sigma-70 family)